MNNPRKAMDAAIKKFDSSPMDKTKVLSEAEINELLLDMTSFKSEVSEQDAQILLIQEAFKLGWYAAYYGARHWDDGR